MEMPPSQHSSAWVRKRLLVAVNACLKRGGLHIFLFASLFTSFALAQDVPQNQPGAAQSPQDQAQGYFDIDDARKGLATLADAARKAPTDHAIGAMLYMAIRDHAWHFSQILPVRHMGPVKALAFSPNGDRVASGSDYGEVFVSPTEPLDADAAEARRIKLKVDDAIVGLDFSDDGQRLAIVSKAGWFRIWDLAQNKIVFTAPRADVSTTAFAAAKKSDLFALGLENGAIQVIDSGASKVTADIKPAAGKVLALSFPVGGAKVAAALADGSARVWDATSGQEIGGAIRQKGAITTVGFSPDGRTLAAGDDSGILRIWDPASGAAVTPELDCGAAVKKVSFSPDGSVVAAMLGDDSVTFWDSASGKKLGYILREGRPLQRHPMVALRHAARHGLRRRARRGVDDV